MCHFTMIVINTKFQLAFWHNYSDCISVLGKEVLGKHLVHFIFILSYLFILNFCCLVFCAGIHPWADDKEANILRIGYVFSWIYLYGFEFSAPY